MENSFLFAKLKSRIENAPKIRSMEYLDLLRQITNNNNFLPTMDEVNLVVGSELAITLSILSKNYKWPDNKLYKKINENSSKNIDNELIKEMEKWLEINSETYHIFEVKITLINNWIKSQKVQKDISIDIINDFEKRVALEHDWSLTKIDGQHVIRLYSDGEINSTKSGYCYGDRSVFTSHPPLINYPKVKFPAGCNDFSYVVLPTEELAIKFRNEMSEMMKI
jgi:hypothetical protein